MILIVDTESDSRTKEPISVQLKWGKYTEIIKNFNYLERLSALWSNSEAVIMFNAPYDLGVLSSLKGNTYEYKNDAWELTICGFKYRVKRINGFRNLIKPLGRAPPVIDVLKLWSILISDRDISLKALIKKELGETAIPYSEENAKTRAYQLQDVIQLEKIWYIFLKKVENIPNLRGYGFDEWRKICTPATFAKIGYAERYPLLKQWQEENDKENSEWGLNTALEEAYNGGITCALLHGTRDNTAWYDIHGAYAHVIEYLNMDIYKSYSWENAEYTTDKPLLCFCETDAVLCKINGSLKIFRTKKLTKRYMWNYDIQALQCLFNDLNINILNVYYPRPLNLVPRSLSAVWSDLKEEEEKAHGKTTLREYYKFLSNTSYGITAQREPYRTIHTNMIIAGIITSRAHLILCQMIETARYYGCDWLYSDTDSICVDLHGTSPYLLEKALNDRITPFSCGCEFIGKTRILSLKRYIASNGVDLEGHRVSDKVRLHGKSIYYLDELDMSSMLMGKENTEPLLIGQVGANTERTYNRCLKLNPDITHGHPFMFETRIDSGLCKQDFFNKWKRHIDTKMTIPYEAKTYDDFTRDFHIFDDYEQAAAYFTGKLKEDTDIFGVEYRQWDNEDYLIFGD